jgi:hypothetical protein
VIGAGFAAFHQLSTNAIHGDPWYKGLASAAAHGAIAGVAGAAGAIIGGVIGFAVGGPVGAVVGGLAGGFVGSALAGAGMAAYEAPEGEGWQACGNALVNSVPFVGSVRRFLDNPNDKDRGYQLAADIGFDVLGLALMALGARKGLAEIRTRTAAPVVDQKPPSPPVEEKPPTPPTEEPPVAPKEKPATLPEGNTPTEMGENIGRSVKGQSKGKTSSICKQVEELPLDQKGKTDALEAASKEAFGRTSGQATTAEGDMVVLPREVGTQRPVVGVEPDGTVFSGKADVAFDPTTGQMTATNITKNPPS